MKNLFLSFVFFSICFYASGQTSTQKTNAFIFNFGPSFRITPVHIGEVNPVSSYHPRSLTFDPSVTGLALNLGLQYFLAKTRMSFEVATSFRYDSYAYFDPADVDGFHSKHLPTVDFHGMFYKFFFLRKNMLSTGIGFSSLNNGSDFSHSYTAVNLAGDSTEVSDHYSTQFSTVNISFGYQVKKFRIELANRFSIQENVAYRKHVYIPELRILYNLSLKNEKSLK